MRGATPRRAKSQLSYNWSPSPRYYGANAATRVLDCFRDYKANSTSAFGRTDSPCDDGGRRVR